MSGTERLPLVVTVENHRPAVIGTLRIVERIQTESSNSFRGRSSRISLMLAQAAESSATILLSSVQ